MCWFPINIQQGFNGFIALLDLSVVIYPPGPHIESSCLVPYDLILLTCSSWFVVVTCTLWSIPRDLYVVNYSTSYDLYHMTCSPWTARSDPKPVTCSLSDLVCDPHRVIRTLRPVFFTIWNVLWFFPCDLWPESSGSVCWGDWARTRSFWRRWWEGGASRRSWCRPRAADSWATQELRLLPWPRRHLPLSRWVT